MIRIVLADDHAIVRAGFRALIEQEPDFRIVAECGNADEARAATLAQRPDMLVLDLSMPGGGMTLLSELRLLMPSLRLVVLSMHDREPYVSEAIRRGAHAYVSKGAATDELVFALRAVQAGQVYLSVDLRRADRTPQIGLEQLTEREREVFLLLARGLTPKQAAFDLDISIKTAYVHRAAIRDKLGARNDMDLHRIAIERGVL